MSNTCGFGQIKDGRVNTLCVKGKVVIDENRNFTGRNGNFGTLNIRKHVDGDLCVCGKIKELKNVGYISSQADPQFDVNGFYALISKKFPVKQFKSYVLTVNRDTNGINAVVNEMEAKVNEYKACGIDHIIIDSTSSDAEPFIEGSAGSLGGVHSDIRHPNVTFYPVAQGTTAVDNASRWVRYADFRSTTKVSAESLLPTPGAGKQFILATDYSAAILSTNEDVVEVATANGYTIVEIDLMWNNGTYQFDNIAGLDAALLAAPAGSVCGLSISASSESTFFERYLDMTVKGTASPNIFNPGNPNVTYFGMNFIPFGLGTGIGSLAVDLEYGLSSSSGDTGIKNSSNEVIQPVNPYLVCIGYPEDIDEARQYNVNVWQDAGSGFAQIFSKISDCKGDGIDAKTYHSTDLASGVAYFAQTATQPANQDYFSLEYGEVIVNPAWKANLPSRLVGNH